MSAGVSYVPIMQWCAEQERQRLLPDVRGARARLSYAANGWEMAAERILATYGDVSQIRQERAWERVSALASRARRALSGRRVRPLPE